MPTVIVIGELEKDQAEYRRGIFAGFKVGVGAQVICCTPEIGFELFELVFRHVDFRTVEREMPGFYVKQWEDAKS